MRNEVVVLVPLMSAGITSFGAASVGGTSLVADGWKIAANLFNAASFVSPIPANGVAGAGFCSASISPRAVARMASTEAVFGMGTWAGNHSRVSVIL